MSRLGAIKSICVCQEEVPIELDNDPMMMMLALHETTKGWMGSHTQDSGAFQAPSIDDSQGDDLSAGGSGDLYLLSDWGFMKI